MRVLFKNMITMDKDIHMKIQQGFTTTNPTFSLVTREMTYAERKREFLLYKLAVKEYKLNKRLETFLAATGTILILSIAYLPFLFLSEMEALYLFLIITFTAVPWFLYYLDNLFISNPPIKLKKPINK